MNFFVGTLTFLLVIDCFVLILLVLVQLPKKDAGAGIAFGGGTADALFGAGSGNVLTKITKYATIVLLALALVISILQDRARNSSSAATFEKMVEQKQMQKPITQPPTQTAPAATPQPAANNFITTPTVATNAPVTK
ncbi:MAG TPA: preprotein translocase subunit SecG [Verrucomicrobiae bacterium]